MRYQDDVDAGMAFFNQLQLSLHVSKRSETKLFYIQRPTHQRTRREKRRTVLLRWHDALHKLIREIRRRRSDLAHMLHFTQLRWRANERTHASVDGRVGSQYYTVVPHWQADDYNVEGYHH